MHMDCFVNYKNLIILIIIAISLQDKPREFLFNHSHS